MNELGPSTSTGPAPRLGALAVLNAGYFTLEALLAVGVGSASLFFDSLEFLEAGVFFAILGIFPHWSVTRRALATGLVVLPLLIITAASAYTVWPRSYHSSALSTLVWLAGGLGALAVNVFCFLYLRRHRSSRGKAGRSGYLVAQADVWGNLIVILAAALTYATHSRWPDLAATVLVVAVQLFTFTKLLGEERPAKDAMDKSG